MLRYFVHTLGCKLNQFDSAATEALLRGGGAEPTSDPAAADVIVLNTCTVTGRADAEGRRLARMYRRIAPGARIVATGCYAERDPEALRRTGAFDEVVGLSRRDELPAALLGDGHCEVALPAGLVARDRVRALLRVQEGCDLRCSYCIIPAVRGPSRSTPAADLRAALRDLAARGVREVGLTGVNTGSWGRDLAPRRELADLLEELLLELAALPSPLRLRLNSLEPRTVSRRVLALVAAAPERIAAHIQVPLQSGSDRVLSRMSRNYRTGFYRAVVERAVGLAPDICVGADVIAGFPGETDDDHRTTLSFVESLPLGYLHVFSYSPRPGARAADWSGAVDPGTIRTRTNELRAAGSRLARSFRERRVGQEQWALVLDAAPVDGWRRALTGNYVEVLLPEACASPGALVPVRMAVLERDGKIVRAEIAA